MINVTIYLKKQHNAKELIKFLLSKKLISSASIDENNISYKLVDSSFVEEVDNEGIQIYGSVAITMGNVWVTGKDGKEVMVDKTWVFRKGKDGKLRIIVHKSSLPYSPAIK